MAEPQHEMPQFEELGNLEGETPPPEMFAEAAATGDAPPVTEEPIPGEAAANETAPLESLEGETAALDKAEEKAEEKGEEKEAEKEEKEEEEEKETLLQRLEKINPYMVMLGIALLLLVIGIFCLYMELRTYDLDIKAEQAKQKLTLAPAAQRDLLPGTPHARPEKPSSGET